MGENTLLGRVDKLVGLEVEQHLRRLSSVLAEWREQSRFTLHSYSWSVNGIRLQTSPKLYELDSHNRSYKLIWDGI